MKLPRTKLITPRESKSGELDDPQSLRRLTLESALRFKTSWIELGQNLRMVWEGKHYLRWGYERFEGYCKGEIGIRFSTALKLLRCYRFLENEEREYLKMRREGSSNVVAFPSADAIDILRQAKGQKTLGENDYQTLRYYVLEKGEDSREVKDKLKKILESSLPADPEEVKEKRRWAVINRFLSVLKNLQREIEQSKLLSSEVIREIERLITRIEAEK